MGVNYGIALNVPSLVAFLPSQEVQSRLCKLLAKAAVMENKKTKH